MFQAITTVILRFNCTEHSVGMIQRTSIIVYACHQSFCIKIIFTVKSKSYFISGFMINFSMRSSQQFLLSCSSVSNHLLQLLWVNLTTQYLCGNVVNNSTESWNC